jgi:hypothetical protein
MHNCCRVVSAWSWYLVIVVLLMKGLAEM